MVVKILSFIWTFLKLAMLIRFRMFYSILRIPAEIYRILSLKQLRDTVDGDADSDSTIRPGNKIHSLPVDPSLDNDDVRKNCCAN